MVRRSSSEYDPISRNYSLWEPSSNLSCYCSGKQLFGGCPGAARVDRTRAMLCARAACEVGVYTARAFRERSARNRPTAESGAPCRRPSTRSVRRTLWREAERPACCRRAGVDARDGFIHFSTAAQVGETAAKHFAGGADLVLLAVDADALGRALKWEVSRGGDLFPHLYGDVAARCGEMGEAAAARRRPAARFSGARAVIGLLESLARPLLRLLDPEDAHRLAITR